MSLHNILERGYFPKELPTPFTTKSFADLLSSNIPLKENFLNLSPKVISKPTKYSHARGGMLLRRQLSIVNPVNYYLLVNEISRNWTVLQQNLVGNSLSSTAPEFKIHGRAINGKYSLKDRAALTSQSRIGKKYILQTDITRFYHSIYTHSIPWAIHSKKTAKLNHSSNLVGNRIDTLIRNSQDKQTIGIPIGPDISLVVAEIIIQNCDKFLVNNFSKITGVRFVDDYELSFKTRSEAEDVFHSMSSFLINYELELNIKKTHILELPIPLDSLWVNKLKGFKFRLTKSGEMSDLNIYFDLAFALHVKFPNEPILQFAISRLRFQNFKKDNFANIQRLLLLCIVPEPSSLPYVLEYLVIIKNNGGVILDLDLQECINTIILLHAKKNHSSEVANALWACLAFDLKIEKEAVDLLSKCNDSVIALLTLDCSNHNLLLAPLNTTIWESLMVAETLYSEHWLLAYEANIKNWLPNKNNIDFVKNDINFGFLKENGVSFYNTKYVKFNDISPIKLPTLPNSIFQRSIYSS